MSVDALRGALSRGVDHGLFPLHAARRRHGPRAPPRRRDPRGLARRREAGARRVARGFRPRREESRDEGRPRPVKAVLVRSLEDIAVVEMEKPVPGPGEIVVAMKAVGICGSDTTAWYVASKAPVVLGHEPAGVVAETGARRRRLPARRPRRRAPPRGLRGVPVLPRRRGRHVPRVEEDAPPPRRARGVRAGRGGRGLDGHAAPSGRPLVRGRRPRRAARVRGEGGAPGADRGGGFRRGGRARRERHPARSRREVGGRRRRSSAAIPIPRGERTRFDWASIRCWRPKRTFPRR